MNHSGSCDHKHSPSNRRHFFSRFLDFFLHGKKLYNKKTYTASCAYCAEEIQISPAYHKWLPITGAIWGVIVASIGIPLFYINLGILAMNTTKNSIDLLFISIFVISAFLICLVFLLISVFLWHLNRSFWLTILPWKSIDKPNAQPIMPRVSSINKTDEKMIIAYLVTVTIIYFLMYFALRLFVWYLSVRS